MNKINRRNLLASAAFSALASTAFAEDAPAPVVIDKVAFNAPPAMGEMSMGKEDAKVVVVEYASASCPHCAAFNNEEFPKFKTDFIDSGKVKYIFREFPHNDPAMGAFMIARCAPKEKYFPLVDVLFKTQKDWVPNPLEGLKKIALQSGFTEETFMACLNNKEVAKNIFEVRQKGDTFGVEGIPTFFINGEHFKGEYTVEGLKAVIDPLLG
jgi:protein-disulfide isomerase